MAKAPSPKSFEQALNELEALVKRMESGQPPLKELVQCYQSGAKLVEICQKELETAELTILEVKNNLKTQSPTFEAFKQH